MPLSEKPAKLATEIHKFCTAGLFLLLLVLPCVLRGQKVVLGTHALDSLMIRGIEERAFPGGVLMVTLGDETVFLKSYGYHTYEKQKRTETHDLFDLASITKVAAATLALMKLYDEGLVDLDAPVGQYVSGLNLNRHRRSTLRELLAHQSGWQSWIPYYKSMKSEKGWKKRFLRSEPSERFPLFIADSLYLTRKMYRYIKSSIRKSPIDEEKKYEYSGLFFYLVPEMVKTLSGMDFESYLAESFYKPMGLETMCFNPVDKFPLHRIIPTEIDDYFRNHLIHGYVHDEGAITMGGISGNAGLFSNAEDLAKLWMMLLRGGTHAGKSYLRAETINLFTTTQYPSNENRRGLGFDKPPLDRDADSYVSKYASSRSFGHSGFTGTMIWGDPESDLVFLLLTNRVYPDRDRKTIYQMNIRPNLHNLVYENWVMP